MSRRLANILICVPFLIILGTVVGGRFLGRTKTTQQKPAPQFQQATVTPVVKAEPDYIEMVRNAHGDMLIYILDQIPKEEKTPEFWKRAAKANSEVLQFSLLK